jgi:hypothetical protein
MTHFIKRATAYLTILISIHLLAMLCYPASSNPFYKRFTSDRQNSLVIGSSRAAQGIVPSNIHKVLNDSSIRLYNYSFTKSTSPFGSIYLSSIKRKLAPHNKNITNLFIIEVNPWAIATQSKSDNPDEFIEVGGLLDNIKLNSLNPNPFYFIDQYDKGWGNMFIEKENPSFNLTNDGWLEVTPNLDSIGIVNNTARKIEDYRTDELPRSNKSKERLNQLSETIKFFLPRGKVVLVRLPISKEILAIENELYPDFNQEIKKLTNKNVYYLNYSEDIDKIKFNDGNHMAKESSRVFSNQLGLDLNHIYK